MAEQRILNAFVLKRVKEMLTEYTREEDLEPDSEISYAEAQEALQHTISHLCDLPIKL